MKFGKLLELNSSAVQSFLKICKNFFLMQGKIMICWISLSFLLHNAELMVQAFHFFFLRVDAFGFEFLERIFESFQFGYKFEHLEASVMTFTPLLSHSAEEVRVVGPNVVKPERRLGSRVRVFMTTIRVGEALRVFAC